MTSNCRTIAERLTAPGKGILAADESIGTMSSRLEQAGVEPTAENRRVYRELLATAPNLSDSVSGIIFCDETLGQTFSDGTPFPQAVLELGILPGIKVDTGAKPCRSARREDHRGTRRSARSAGEVRRHGGGFRQMARGVRDNREHTYPWAIRANANALGRYAAACQAGLVPIVEPEVLMDGRHNRGRCRDVTAEVHAAVRTELELLNVDLAGIVLKPNMVLEGQDYPDRPSTPEEIAEATVSVLRAWPEELAGVAFLSGGQSPERATANLEAMQKHETPWPLTFSFGRALVSPALTAWHGDPQCYADGQAALVSRVVANAAVARLRVAS
ncbi:class I fructose-bisphosphate aldolase [Mycolicibacterium agri]|nr:class I fructose-bisphosphate aldolase [Mycolicibacterium agri]